MSSPAFIVDGHQEQKIVHHVCPSAPVRRLNCNGDNVAISAAAKRAASLIRLFGNRHWPIVIIFDREGREETWQQVREEFLKCLLCEGVRDQCILGVPDRMIENWLLADWNNSVQRLSLAGGRPQEIEGTHGKSLVRSRLPKGRFYNECTEGFDWFLSASPIVMYKGSSSFRGLADALLMLQCHWLDAVRTSCSSCDKPT